MKKLGYDKFLNENNLENVEYNINELKEKYVNFFKIINANKISLCYNIDKIFIDYLNKKERFKFKRNRYINFKFRNIN